MEATPVGLTKDAGWQIGVQATVDAQPDEVWAFLTSPPGLALWLGEVAALELDKGATYRTGEGTIGEVKSYHAGKRFRLSWQPDGWERPSTLQVTIRAAASGTAIRFHQERLTSSRQRAAMRARWRAVLARIGEHLGG